VKVEQKKSVTPTIQMLGSLKFQMRLVSMIDDSGVYGHVMCGICPARAQLQQFSMVTHLENWSRLEVQEILCFL
jgi:hypothetical protein